MPTRRAAGLAARQWPADVQLHVRMGLHTGIANLDGDDYWGLTVHEAARISGGGARGQVIVSAETAAAAGAPRDRRGATSVCTG